MLNRDVKVHITVPRYAEKDGRRAVYWKIDGHWVHKGWLMPEVPRETH